MAPATSHIATLMEAGAAAGFHPRYLEEKVLPALRAAEGDPAQLHLVMILETLRRNPEAAAILDGANWPVGMPQATNPERVGVRSIRLAARSGAHARGNGMG